MGLCERLQASLDELRMQMLGTEVFFGFQLEGTFKEGLAHLSRTARIVDAMALSAVVLALAAMIAAPAQHRLIERGDASLRVLHATQRFASYALLSLAIAVGCDVYVVSDFYLGDRIATIASIATFALAISLWFLLGFLIKATSANAALAPTETVPLHEKIKQMLHESWIVLPGATGIFGFQLIITMASTFESLPAAIQYVHFGALALVIIGLILLISPAAVHRLAFAATDDPRSHSVGSRLLTAAFAPLALGISLDYYVAIGRLLGYGGIAKALSIIVAWVLPLVWYIIPWYLRTSRSRTQAASDALTVTHST